MSKICTLCKIEKSFSEYGKASNLKDGHKGQCKPCRKIEKRIYKAKNKERELELQRKWRKNNPDKVKEYNIKYKVRIDNYYAENSDKVKARMSKYCKTKKGREVSHLNNSKRRALRKTTEDGSITYTALKRLRHLQDNKCYHCGCELQYNISFEVHLDHYIPISKGGTHTINNVVWSCKTCNLKKNNTLPTESLNV